MQSMHGQWQVLSARRPIAEVVADQSQPPKLRTQLQTIQEMRRFAVDQLQLPDNRSYTSYSDIKRRFVITNVFATPELSLTPVRSCFPFVGCLDYRGYFRNDMARHYAAELRAKGLDVYVGDVAAYSTLGWFDDPVLNSMLNWDEAKLAKFLFHELAHQQLYVKNDTAFNEAFAESVALEGLKRWWRHHPDAPSIQKLREEEYRESAFIDLVLQTKRQLQAIYDSSAVDEEKRARKREALDSFRQRYLELKKQWRGYAGYDAWVNDHLNNAKIAAVVTYNDLIPAFRALLRIAHGQLPGFYALAARIGERAAAERRQCLAALMQQAGASAPDCLAKLPP